MIKEFMTTAMEYQYEGTKELTKKEIFESWLRSKCTMGAVPGAFGKPQFIPVVRKMKELGYESLTEDYTNNTISICWNDHTQTTLMKVFTSFVPVGTEA